MYNSAMRTNESNSKSVHPLLKKARTPIACAVLVLSFGCIVLPSFSTGTFIEENAAAAASEIAPFASNAGEAGSHGSQTAGKQKSGAFSIAVANPIGVDVILQPGS